MSLSLFLPPRAILMSRLAIHRPPTAIQGTRLVFFDVNSLADSGSTLLGRMIEAMGLKRTDVLLCRDHAELANAAPQVIVALGQTSFHVLLKQAPPELGRPYFRGKFQNYPHADFKAKIMPTFHPGELLINASLKREAWNDLLAVAAELGIQIPKRSN